MRKPAVAILLILVAIGCFLAGYGLRPSAGHPSANRPSSGRKVLYWADPMTPGFRSDKPGVAPCGMPLEPVYADGAPAASGPGPASVVQLRPGVEQLIGVKLEEARTSPWSQTIRLPGTVAVDENRVFRVTAATDGWVKRVLPPTTDTIVAKDQVLATFYAPEFFSALKAYLYALRAAKQSRAGSEEGQEDTFRANLENYKVSLRNLGMTEPQLDEIERTQKGTDNVEIRSPAAGVILTRGISSGQRFGKGADLYKVADLSRVWILADLYDNAARLAKPGTRMEVTSPYLAKPFWATLAATPPRFDPVTRTLKLRLEAENPGQLLRPDMFVDVQFRVQGGPPALTVPADAVLATGLTRSIFVELAPGRFERRLVRTGRSAGDRVEIVSGLREGERVVVSGNFLLDSESRMKAPAAEGAPAPGGGHTHPAAAGTAGSAEAVDPRCGMKVDPLQAQKAGLVGSYQGTSYYFCSPACKTEFDKAPAKFLAFRARMRQEAGHD